MSSTKSKTNKNIKWQWIVSVILILAIAGFWFLKKANNNATTTYVMNDEEFYQYILHTNARSSEVDTEQERNKAYNLFTAKEFNEALPLLTTLWQEKQDTLAYFYLGISYLQLNQCDKATAIFNSQVLNNYPTEELIKKCSGNME
jgi:4-amino-4-deoxy-L-arabinose transferase-like glycosyltransferase